jgi:trans-aconitate methyltransferase
MACVGVLDIDPRSVLEPSVGGGAFARAVAQRWPQALLEGVDIDPTVTGRHDVDSFECCDFLAHYTQYDLIVGNPPFTHAESHVRQALSLAAPGGVVAFLLRLAFLEGQRRRALWDAFPPAEVHVLSRRPSFTGGGTDSAAYGFFVWNQFSATTKLSWL